MMYNNSTKDDGDTFTVERNYVIATGGGVLLLLFILFSVTFLLLCVVLRRLSKLSRLFQELRKPEEAKEKMRELGSESGTANNRQSHSEEQVPGTELSNTEADTEKYPDAVTALYATVPEEHRQKKKMAKLCIQQYDDIHLLPLDSRETREGEEEASVTIEGGGGEGYSRLCHAGPRINQSKRFAQSSLSASTPQLLDEMGDRKDSFSGSVKVDNKPYSEVAPMRPRSTLLVPSGIKGTYSMIKHGDDDSVSPPPLPVRVNKLSHSPPNESGLLKETRSSNSEKDPTHNLENSATQPPIPYQNIPAVGDTSGDPTKIRAGYSVVANPVSPPRVTDGDFFTDVLEFHNLQAAEEKTQEQLYEKVK